MTTQEERRRQRQQLQEHNRRHLPKVSAFVDELRSHFGDVRVEYASEGGFELGTDVTTQDIGLAPLQRLDPSEPQRYAVICVRTHERRIGPKAVPVRPDEEDEAPCAS